MSVPRSRRKESKLEACHNFYKLRDEITELMLMDFGFSVEKYEKKIDRYAYTHRNAVNLDDLIARQRKRCESFYSWFIDKENDALLEIMRNIETEFTLGNFFIETIKAPSAL